jgi:hypothetical protein
VHETTAEEFANARASADPEFAVAAILEDLRIVKRRGGHPGEHDRRVLC